MLPRLPILNRAGIANAVDARGLHALVGSGEFEPWLRAITTDPQWRAGVDFIVTKDSPNARNKSGKVGAAVSMRVATHCLCVAIFGVAA